MNHNFWERDEMSGNFLKDRTLTNNFLDTSTDTFWWINYFYGHIFDWFDGFFFGLIIFSYFRQKFILHSISFKKRNAFNYKLKLKKNKNRIIRHFGKFWPFLNYFLFLLSQIIYSKIRLKFIHQKMNPLK